MRNLITGMDVGTSKVCVLVGDSPLDGDLAILGYGVAPCTGLRKVAALTATGLLRCAAAKWVRAMLIE